jgi:peptidylprolyl isomerase
MSVINDYLVLKTTHGISLIELYRDKAPKHVERIMELAEKGFYNDLKFHRVIEGFMAQTGCPDGTGRGGSQLPNLKAEFNDLHHARGIVSMARAQDPNSANSQFFIMFQAAGYLDNQYTAFGKVIKGMDKIDLIKKGQAPNGTNFDQEGPDKIIELYIPNQETLAELLALTS